MVEPLLIRPGAGNPPQRIPIQWDYRGFLTSGDGNREPHFNLFLPSLFNADGSEHILQTFIENGADVNLANNYGETPLMRLMRAARFNICSDSLQILIGSGRTYTPSVFQLISRRV